MAATYHPRGFWTSPSDHSGNQLCQHRHLQHPGWFPHIHSELRRIRVVFCCPARMGGMLFTLFDNVQQAGKTKVA